MTAHEFGGIPNSDVTPVDVPPSVPEEEPDKSSFLQRCREIIGSATEDYQESDHKFRMIGLAAVVGTLQTLDRARLSVFLVPTVAANVYESTNSPLAAAAAATATCMVWCAGVGGATGAGLQQYPRAVERFGDNFPGAVDFLNDSLPGAEMSKAPADASRREKVKRFGSNLVTRAHRGLTVAGIGSVAYTGNAVANGKSAKEVQMLNLNASLDGSATVGAVVAGVGATVSLIGHDHPEVATRVQETAANPYLWYGAAGIAMGGQFISNYIKKRKARPVLAAGAQL